MPIAPSLARPGSALAVASRPPQSGWRLLGHRTRANGAGVSSAALPDGASKHAFRALIGSDPRDRPSPAPHRRDRFRRRALVRPGRSNAG
jgi:hypothetical protein